MLRVDDFMIVRLSARMDSRFFFKGLDRLSARRGGRSFVALSRPAPPPRASARVSSGAVCSRRICRIFAWTAKVTKSKE